MATTLAFDLKAKMAQLSEKFLAKTPDMPVILQEIHDAIHSDPESVTTLEEDEIGLIVQSLGHAVNVSITATLTKSSKASTTKQFKGKSADDILAQL